MEKEKEKLCNKERHKRSPKITKQEKIARDVEINKPNKKEKHTQENSFIYIVYFIFGSIVWEFCYLHYHKSIYNIRIIVARKYTKQNQQHMISLFFQHSLFLLLLISQS